MPKICVISADDVKLLQSNVILDCSNHIHIKRCDAMEMTRRGDFKPYFVSIAEWVGPHHIRMLYVYDIRDLSCRLGETHVLAIRRRKLWALVMHADIRRRGPLVPDEFLES